MMKHGTQQEEENERMFRDIWAPLTLVGVLIASLLATAILLPHGCRDTPTDDQQADASDDEDVLPDEDDE
ncbi:MAG: hypothetical protein ABIG66_00265 [Candidatus Kerfeldbacteria bacterium]